MNRFVQEHMHVNIVRLATWGQRRLDWLRRIGIRYIPE